MTVMRTDWRGQVGAPKGGRARKIPLTPRAVAALKGIRHLRSKLVFCWEAIQELAGHQSITVTNRYMHLAPGELRSAIALRDRSAVSGQQVANGTNT